MKCFLIITLFFFSNLIKAQDVIITKNDKKAIKIEESYTESNDTLTQIVKNQSKESIFKIGVKGGINYSTLHVKSAPYNSYSSAEVENSWVGYHAGIVIKVKLSKKIALQPEFVYSEQGAEIVKYTYLDYGGANVFKKNIALKYINIPLLINYKLFNGFEVQSGPQLGINVSGIGYVFEFGIGAGVQFTLPANMFFQARYVYGLSNIINNKGLLLSYLSYDFYNRVASLSVGYFIN